MLYGAGSLALVSNDMTTNGSTRAEDLLFPGCIASFTLDADVNFAEAKCFADGKLQIAASEITEETFSLSLSFEYADWQTMQIAYDEYAQASTGVVVPLLKTATVPAGLVITDPDIVSATAGSVKVYIASKGAYGDRTFANIVSTAPAAFNEVQVDGSANTLTFNSALAGATVSYVVNKSYTSIESIGAAPNRNQIGSLQFSGLCYGTEFAEPVLLYIRQMRRTGVPSLSIEGDVSTLEVEYRPQLAPGKRSVFEFYRFEGAVPA